MDGGVSFLRGGGRRCVASKDSERGRAGLEGWGTSDEVLRGLLERATARERILVVEVARLEADRGRIWSQVCVCVCEGGVCVCACVCVCVRERERELERVAEPTMNDHLLKQQSIIHNGTAPGNAARAPVREAWVLLLSILATTGRAKKRLLQDEDRKGEGRFT